MNKKYNLAFTTEQEDKINSLRGKHSHQAVDSLFSAEIDKTKSIDYVLDLASKVNKVAEREALDLLINIKSESLEDALAFDHWLLSGDFTPDGGFMASTTLGYNFNQALKGLRVGLPANEVAKVDNNYIKLVALDLVLEGGYSKEIFPKIDNQYQLCALKVLHNKESQAAHKDSSAYTDSVLEIHNKDELHTFFDKFSADDGFSGAATSTCRWLLSNAELAEFA